MKACQVLWRNKGRYVRFVSVFMRVVYSLIRVSHTHGNMVLSYKTFRIKLTARCNYMVTLDVYLLLVKYCVVHKRLRKLTSLTV
jgi:hypothetical protein